MPGGQTWTPIGGQHWTPIDTERIRAEGDEPGDGSPQRLAELVAREHRIFGEVVRAQNIRAE